MKNIQKLQESVLTRLDKIEKSGLEVDQVEVPQIRFL